MPSIDFSIASFGYSISDKINMVGGNYTYFTGSLVAKLQVAQAITDQAISNINASVKYSLNSNYQFQFEYQKLNSLPNLNYSLNQSSYIDYNWYKNW